MEGNRGSRKVKGTDEIVEGKGRGLMGEGGRECRK